jgi:hypothetical protein
MEPIICPEFIQDCFQLNSLITVLKKQIKATIFLQTDKGFIIQLVQADKVNMMMPDGISSDHGHGIQIMNNIITISTMNSCPTGAGYGSDLPIPAAL